MAPSDRHTLYYPTSGTLTLRPKAALILRTRQRRCLHGHSTPLANPCSVHHPQASLFSDGEGLTHTFATNIAEAYFKVQSDLTPTAMNDIEPLQAPSNAPTQPASSTKKALTLPITHQYCSVIHQTSPNYPFCNEFLLSTPFASLQVCTLALVNARTVVATSRHHWTSFPQVHTYTVLKPCRRRALSRGQS